MHFNTQRMARRQREHRNRHCGARHIDGGTQRNRHPERVFGKIQLAAQIHVHRNVGGGGTREKRHHAGFFKDRKRQRIGIFFRAVPNDEGVQYQRHKGHAPQKKAQELRITHENAEAFRRERIRHQTENPDGGATDYDVHDEFHTAREIIQNFTGAVRSLLERNAEPGAPRENPDVVAGQKRMNRIIYG